MRENLKAARKAAGLTQQQMADKLGDLSLRQYQRLESGAAYGTFEQWDRMEELFNVHQRVLREIRPVPRANQ